MRLIVLALMFATITTVACAPTTINPRTGVPPLIPGFLEEDLGTPTPQTSPSPSK